MLVGANTTAEARTKTENGALHAIHILFFDLLLALYYSRH